LGYNTAKVMNGVSLTESMHSKNSEQQLITQPLPSSNITNTTATK